ncbi:hypothetical protein [Mesorhizobium argentiipisi]|uniref:MarR family transcriptional regulator n=1 Tax=Mesorhizobium argentiipisi TaxID=3015175 RepID=A0ABU8KB82_9HYPH
MTTSTTVVPFPAPAEETPSGNCEKIWGKKGKLQGYAAIPSIMVRAQRRLGINTTQFCILVQLIEYLRIPGRDPFPTPTGSASRLPQ